MLKRLSEQFSSVMHRGAEFLRSKYMRRTLTAFSIVAILVGIFVIAAPTYADQGFLEEVANGIINGVSYILIAVAGVFIQLTIFALKFFIEVAGYNNFIDADIVQLGWNMVRDVANMFFVVVLLVIAFGTILGLEQYEWKKTLIKLVMAAFFVNFSNLICQLIIDVAQVFTITFLNAVAGAAGGNLIKMFNFDEILNISSRNTDPTGIQIEFFAGAVMTVTFAGMAMATMGAYLVVIIARMVVLWTLMILSPLAFLFSALPNTQSYAQEFWNEFIHHVIVAPVMVFFLWLAFATFGGGNIVQTNIEANHPMIIDGGINRVTDATDAAGNVLGVSISAAASWENMANFAVAIAFLWIGIERVQKLGVVGGGIVSGAMAFGKNVATIGSGLALGRWLGSGAKGLATKGIGAAAWYMPWVGGKELTTRLKNKQAAAKAWWYGKAAGLDPKAEANIREMKGNQALIDEYGQKNAEIDEKLKPDYKDKDGNQLSAKDRTSLERVKSYNEARIAGLTDGNKKLERETNKILSGGFVGTLARRSVALEKTLKKNESFAENREKIAFKRSGSEAGDWLFLRSVKDIKRRDRYERGLYQAEEFRGGAVDEDVEGLGKYEGLSNRRIKDGKLLEGQTVQEMAAVSKLAGETYNNNLHSIDAEARLRVITEGQGENADKNFIPASFKLAGYKDMGEYVESQINAHEQADVLSEAIKQMITDKENEHLDHANHDMQEAAELLTEAAHIQTDAAKELRKKSMGYKQQLAPLESGRKDRLKEIENAKANFEQSDGFKNIAEKIDEITAKEGAIATAQNPAEKEQHENELKVLISQKENLELASKEFQEYKKKQDEYNSWYEGNPTTDEYGNVVNAGAKAEIEGFRSLSHKYELDAIAADKADPTIANRKKELEDRAEEIMQRSLVGKLAYVKAKATDGELFKNAKHSQLFDSATQMAVWDKRGISTPNMALTPILERYASEFNDMTYHGTVMNIRNSLKKVMEKSKSGAEIPEADKLSLMALFQHMFKNGWVDDGIPAIMDDAQVKSFMAENFDWKDTSFDWQKINDIQAMFATGMNADFAAVHGKAKLGQILDVATGDLEVDPSQVFEALKAGSNAQFRDGNGVDVTAKVIKKLEDRGINFAEVTKNLNAGAIEKYVEILEQNQTQLQYLGSEDIKERAIMGGHPENAGHTQFREIGKKKMYIVAGANMAKNGVFSDANKMGSQARVKMHPHALASRDEKRGVMLKMDIDNLRIARGDVKDPRSFSGTSQRLINERVGLASTEDYTKYQGAGGRLSIGGEFSTLHESYQENFADQYKGLDYSAKVKKTSDLFVQNVLIPQLRTNPADFLMSVASRSNVDPMVALRTGKINITLGGKKYDSINQLIQHINDGKFGSVAGSVLAQYKGSADKSLSED